MQMTGAIVKKRSQKVYGNSKMRRSWSARVMAVRRVIFLYRYNSRFARCTAESEVASSIKSSRCSKSNSSLELSVSW